MSFPYNKKEIGPHILEENFASYVGLLSLYVYSLVN